MTDNFSTRVVATLQNLRNVLNTKQKGISFQSTAPTSASVNDLWVNNTASADPILNIYNGQNWINPVGAIYQLDDISNLFTGTNTRFQPRYNNSVFTIINPLRLNLSINGTTQKVRSIDNVWLCDIIEPGFFIDNEGYIALSEAPEPGSTVDIKVIPGSNIDTRATYPFKALNILLGV